MDDLAQVVRGGDRLAEGGGLAVGAVRRIVQRRRDSRGGVVAGAKSLR